MSAERSSTFRAPAVLYSSVFSTTQTNVDIQNIPASWAHLRVYLVAKTTVSAVDDQLLLRFNNDSGSNYDSVNTELRSGSNFSGNSAATTWGNCAYAVGATGDSTRTCGNDILIADYTGTTLFKSWRCHCYLNWNSSSNQYNLLQSGQWRSTSAINRVTILSGGGGSFSAGTKVTLIGIPG